MQRIQLCHLFGGPCGLKKFFNWGGKTGGVWGCEVLCSLGEPPVSNWNVKEMVDGAAPGKRWLVTSLHSKRAKIYPPPPHPLLPTTHSSLETKLPWDAAYTTRGGKVLKSKTDVYDWNWCDREILHSSHFAQCQSEMKEGEVREASKSRKAFGF